MTVKQETAIVISENQFRNTHYFLCLKIVGLIWAEIPIDSEG
jgi:hypothetical protein